MNLPSHKFLDNKYWKLLTTIDSINQDVSFSELASHLGLQYTATDIEEAVAFLKHFGHPIKMETKSQDNWIILTGKKPQFKMNLSLTEWLALQSHFPLMEENKGKAIYNTMANCLNRMEKKYPEADIFNYIDEERSMKKVTRELDHDKDKLLKIINNAHLKDEHLYFESRDMRKNEVFIHKIVYIDGILSIIGEEVNDRCLTCIDINEIQAYSIEQGNNYRPNYASAEVDDFITAIRSISGNEQRLVMKVSSPEKVNLKPDFHFLGNPYITTNTEGEFIWAASVEVSHELYNWLATIYSDIDVIDPKTVKEELESFMENKDSLKYFKKAS